MGELVAEKWTDEEENLFHEKWAEQNRFDPMNVDSDNDEWQANEEEEGEDSVVESPMYQLHPLERSGDHSNKCQDKNLLDETCVDDEYTSPMSAHIRRIGDPQADGDFDPREKTWDERSYHSNQDDSAGQGHRQSTITSLQ